METTINRMWHVSIRVHRGGRKRTAVVHQFYVFTHDAETAKALALADWGYSFRAEKVLAVTAELSGTVARGDLYLTALMTAKPETIPPGAAIDAATKFLEGAESADEAPPLKVDLFRR